MEIINITNPGATPIEGDWIEIHYDNGSIEGKHFHETVVVPESPDSIKKRLADAVQAHLDGESRLRGYDNIVNACGYAAATNPFQVESMSFVSWRGNVWAKCYQIMAEVEDGQRPIPTESELIAMLPVRV